MVCNILCQQRLRYGGWYAVFCVNKGSSMISQIIFRSATWPRESRPRPKCGCRGDVQVSGWWCESIWNDYWRIQHHSNVSGFWKDNQITVRTRLILSMLNSHLMTSALRFDPRFRCAWIAYEDEAKASVLQSLRVSMMCLLRIAWEDVKGRMGNV